MLLVLDKILVNNFSWFLFHVSLARWKFSLSLVIQRWMWTILVIVLPPVINRFPGVNYIAEPVLIQALISKSPVKTFNKSVPGRFARLNKSQLHSMLKGPLIHARQMNSGAWAVLHCLRIATEQRDAVQNTRDLHVWNPESCGDRQALLREIIRTGQAFYSMTGGQCVHDEFHRPLSALRSAN